MSTSDDAGRAGLVRLLREAAGLIRTHGVWRGEYWPEAANTHHQFPYIAGDPCCALGALAVAAELTRVSWADSAFHDSSSLITRAAEALAATVGLPVDQVPDWNDDPDRTPIEVITALEDTADRVGGSSAKTPRPAGQHPISTLPSHQIEREEYPHD